MIDHYDWAGGREAMLRFGPADGPVVIMLPALFEEHNRTRAFAVTICRALADRGVASVLPDLPGQGESVVATKNATLAGWRQAIRSLLEAQSGLNRVLVASIRGGAVLDNVSTASGVWRLSPIAGQKVLSDLQRADWLGRDVNRKDKLKSFGPDSPPTVLVGNAISFPLFAALLLDEDLSEPTVKRRTVRLESDPAPADVKFPGVPLWRRSEPGNDPALAALLADDLADWVRRCAA